MNGLKKDGCSKLQLNKFKNYSELPYRCIRTSGISYNYDFVCSRFCFLLFPHSFFSFHFYHHLLIMLFPNLSFYFSFTIHSFPSILPFISFSYLVKVLLLSNPLKFSFLVTSTDVLYSSLKNEYSLIYLERIAHVISPSFNQYG